MQALLCGLLGTGFASASVIWKIERWSIARQTGIYFLVVSTVMLPVAYLSYWMEHSIKGFIRYMAIFVLIFIVMWIIQFIIAKRNVDNINRKLENAKS